jgi:hypothetical protein
MHSLTGIDLYWLPLGAGGHSVRLNGRIFEAAVARLEQRERCDLYHSALEVRVPEGRFVLEQGPARPSDGADRGVVAEGAVGTRVAARLRVFRYEVRRWRDGTIDDIAEAVESPHPLSDDPDCARRLLELVPQVPTPVWGRDELAAGEMWNSNSVISWLIARSGLDVEAVRPPAGGRAPGWRAGLVVARRHGVGAFSGVFSNDRRYSTKRAGHVTRSIGTMPVSTGCYRSGHRSGRRSAVRVRLAPSLAVERRSGQFARTRGTARE